MGRSTTLCLTVKGGVLLVTLIDGRISINDGMEHQILLHAILLHAETSTPAYVTAALDVFIQQSKIFAHYFLLFASG